MLTITFRVSTFLTSYAHFFTLLHITSHHNTLLYICITLYYTACTLLYYTFTSHYKLHYTAALLLRSFTFTLQFITLHLHYNCIPLHYFTQQSFYVSISLKDRQRAGLLAVAIFPQVSHYGLLPYMPMPRPLRRCTFWRRRRRKRRKARARCCFCHAVGVPWHVRFGEVYCRSCLRHEGHCAQCGAYFFKDSDHYSRSPACEP